MELKINLHENERQTYKENHTLGKVIQWKNQTKFEYKKKNREIQRKSTTHWKQLENTRDRFHKLYAHEHSSISTI